MDTPTSHSANILTSYPFPIAHLYRHLHLFANHKEAHDSALKLFEAVALYLATVLVSQYRHNGSTDIKIEEQLNELHTPAFGHWMGLLSMLQKQLTDSPIASIGRSWAQFLGKKA